MFGLVAECGVKVKKLQPGLVWEFRLLLFRAIICSTV